MINDVGQKQNKTRNSRGQCGFVEGKDIKNATYILWTIIERALEVQKEVYLCFILYHLKAFDRIWHDHHTVEEGWKKSTSDQKNVLGTDSSNTAWWGNQPSKK